MKLKTLWLSIILNSIILTPAMGAMCHFKNPREAGYSLRVAMNRAKECSWGNASGALYFIFTFAEMLQQKGTLTFNPKQLNIEDKYLGKIENYSQEFEQMLLSERQSVEAMFWLQIAYQILTQNNQTSQQFGPNSILRQSLTTLHQLLQKMAKTKDQQKFLAVITEETPLTDTYFQQPKNPKAPHADKEQKVIFVSPAMLKKPETYNKIKEKLIAWPLLPHKNCMTHLSRKCAESLETALTEVATCQSGNAICTKRFLATAIKAFADKLVPPLTLKDVGLNQKQVGKLQNYRNAFQKMDAARQNTFIIYLQGLILDLLYNVKTRTSHQTAIMKNIQGQFEKYYREGKSVGAESNFIIALAPSIEADGKLNISKFATHINTFKGLLR